MHRFRSSMLVLIALALLAVLLAGCGGGSQSGNGSGGGKSHGGAKGQGGQAAKKHAPQQKIALGVVRRVRHGGKVMVVKSRKSAKGSKPQIFVVAKNARITLEGKQAKTGDIEQGQQTQITYIVVKKRNRAQEVKLFHHGGAKKKQPEKTNAQ